MTTDFIQPPGNFEPGDNPKHSWENLKEAYNIYEQACEYATKTNATRKVLLLYVLGGHCPHIMQTFSPQPPSADPAQSQDQVAHLFDQLDVVSKPYKNEGSRRLYYNSVKQKDNQSFDNFLTDLRRQTAKCDFGEKTERLIGDCISIVVGIKDEALREQLLRERDLTLHKIAATCVGPGVSALR